MRRALVMLFAFCVVPGLFAQVGPVQTATITLSSAQLRALHGNPVQLIAAPGAGMMLVPSSVVMQYKFGTTPYTVGRGGNFDGYVGVAANSVFGTAAEGFIDQTSSQIVEQQGLSSLGPFDQTTMANAPLFVKNDNVTEWTDGDGTVTITVYYTVLPLQ